MKNKPAQYTDKQRDALVTKLGNYVEGSYKELVNKEHSTLRSSLSLVFASTGQGTSLLFKTAEACGVKMTTWHGTLDAIVAATEARGSTAADAIKKTVVQTKVLDKTFRDMGFKDNTRDIWKKVRAAKRQP